ncbi:MAG: molybdenum cofactor guanylyltransferase [Gaiellales bacterium]
MRSETGRRLSAIVLAGGRSTRMGTSKALLDWHGHPLLERLCGLLGRIAAPVVVAHAPGQQLPALPAETELAVDVRAGRGPLEGLAAGMRAIGGRADLAFVSAADLPLLHPAFVLALADRLGEHQAAVPVEDGHEQGLAAIYRTSVLTEVERRLGAGRLAVRGLLGDLDVQRVPAAELPYAQSLRNVNGPADLAAALAEPPPCVQVSTSAGGRWVRAATLGDALALTGAGAAAAASAVALNGTSLITLDSRLPLVDGDMLDLVQAVAR